MTPEGQRDRALVERVLAREPQAEEEFAARTVCILHTIAALNCKWGAPFRANDIDDICQETAARVFERLHTFEGRSRLETWIQKFCFNVFRESLRQRTGERARSLDPASFDERHSRDPAQPEAELEPFYRVLSPMQGRVFHMHVVQELDLVEIATELGKSTASVNEHWQRAKDKLRPLLEARKESP